MFVASRSNKLLVSAGHWDNSFRVESLEKGKIITCVAYHQGEGAWCFTGGGGGGGGGIGSGKDRCGWLRTSCSNQKFVVGGGCCPMPVPNVNVC